VSSILPVAGTPTLRREAAGILRAERRPLALVLGFQAIGVLAGLAGPQILARIINDAEAGTSISAVDYLAGFFLALLIVQSVMTGVTRRRAAVLGEKVLAGLRERFVESVLELPLGTVERAGTGDLLTRASTDVDQLSFSMRYSVPEITIAIVQALLTIAALIYTAPILGLTLVPVVIIVSISSRWYLNRAPDGYRRTMAAWTKAIATVQESVSAGRTVEGFRLGPRRVAKSEADLREWLAVEKYTLRLRTIFFPTTEVAYLFPLVLTVLGGGLLHDAGKLSVGSVAAAALYAQLLIDPVDSVVSWLDELQLGSASFARLLGVREVDAPPLTDEVPAGETVEAKKVRFAYREGRDVLNGIDLNLAPGDRLAVVGPSGAGKSTIALLLAGVHPPRTGSVEIGGVEASSLPPAQLREEIALLTQENHVFAGTLRDNLSLVAPDAGDDVLWRAMRAVDAEAWATALPNGLDSDLGPLGTPLTPAKAQQLALARLVLADPHTLVLDEATSLLDPRASRQLERSLGRLLEGRTVVSIAHRLYSAHDADRVAVVDSGRIVEHGTHAELLAAGGTYASLWHSWQGVPDDAPGGSALAGGD
jgi:ABC-type multidrug transport system fused ATPase/permease subunit